jgi:carbon monoxide dehydrogenase subunit G
MKIEQESKVSASRERIWSLLEDVPRAAALIPGVSDVVETGPNTFSGKMQARVGPMKITLDGELTTTQNPEDFTWRIEGNAKALAGGGLRVIVDAAVAEGDADSSTLTVATDIQFMGKLGTMGQPFIRSKANSQMKDFIKNLEKELKQ